MPSSVSHLESLCKAAIFYGDVIVVGGSIHYESGLTRTQNHTDGEFEARPDPSVWESFKDVYGKITQIMLCLAIQNLTCLV